MRIVTSATPVAAATSCVRGCCDAYRGGSESAELATIICRWILGQGSQGALLFPTEMAWLQRSKAADAPFQQMTNRSHTTP